jgi:hypothetical protein
MQLAGKGSKKETHIDVLDDEVVDDHRVARGAHAEAALGQVDGQVQRARPLRAYVGERDDLVRV